MRFEHVVDARLEPVEGTRVGLDLANGLYDPLLLLASKIT